MIQSMTGFGKAEAVLSGGKLSVEIRSLNGKNADINVKSSLLPKDKELYVRALLASQLQRGNIDLYLSWQSDKSNVGHILDKDVILSYLDQIKSILGDTTSIEDEKLLPLVLHLPGITAEGSNEIITEENWPAVAEAIDTAINEVQSFRLREGKALHSDIDSRIDTILSLVNQVESFEIERINAVKARLTENLEALGQKVDPSRFEQEMIFYLEKLDINEEKVRLREHCRYFREVLETDPAPGKKLGFILQEMGREINTTGSKANHAGIQKAVVLMKDELEKIREQSLNVL